MQLVALLSLQITATCPALVATVAVA